MDAREGRRMAFSAGVLPRVFVDMDGTLARFHDHILDEDGAVALELVYEEDFFLQLKPFSSLVEAVRLLAARDDVEVYILSAVANGDFLEQKNAWIARHLPEIPPERRVFTPMGQNKSTYVSSLTRADVLLDDYNKNLRDWERAGGAAVKCVNNVNNRGQGRWGGDIGNLWRGPCVDYRSDPRDISFVLAETAHAGRARSLDCDLARARAAVHDENGVRQGVRERYNGRIMDQSM